MKIGVGSLLTLLRRVYLGGIIEEAVLDFDTGAVKAVDVTNSVFLSCKEAFSVKFGEIGLGDLSLLCKYLGSMSGDLDVVKKDNRLVIKVGKGTLNYLTKDVSFVATMVEGDEHDKLFNPCVYKIKFDEAICKEYLMYAGLVKSKGVDFIVTPNTVEVNCGLESEHQFALALGKPEPVTKGKKAPATNFTVKVYSQHFGAVCGILDFGTATPEVLFAPEHPVVVRQDQNNFWALLPLNELRGE